MASLNVQSGAAGDQNATETDRMHWIQEKSNVTNAKCHSIKSLICCHLQDKYIITFGNVTLNIPYLSTKVLSTLSHFTPVEDNDAFANHQARWHWNRYSDSSQTQKMQPHLNKSIFYTSNCNFARIQGWVKFCHSFSSMTLREVSSFCLKECKAIGRYLYWGVRMCHSACAL